MGHVRLTQSLAENVTLFVGCKLVKLKSFFQEVLELPFKQRCVCSFAPEEKLCVNFIKDSFYVTVLA